MKALLKSTIREIKKSIGRYLAMLVIVALGVGFFAGLRACRPSMVRTAGSYYDMQNFYDYRLLSTAGFSKEEIRLLQDETFISAAEGALYEDVLFAENENDFVVRVHSVTNQINRLSLISGRLPENDSECVADADFYGEEMIGKTLRISDTGGDGRQTGLRVSEFTIVGVAKTPLYISNERGTTSVGDGKIAAFLFVNASCFTSDAYRELYVTLQNHEEAYSDAYRNLISENRQNVTASAEGQNLYVLTRSENAGYAAFSQDSTIVENISVVFPVFFFLVAALVCVTSMTRMVEEQRTQIGVWKAMGYHKGQICCKYLLYAGSAGLIGGIAGFFFGTALIPMIFWGAYRISYNFSDFLLYTFDFKLFALSLGIAVFCTAGTSYLCCRKALHEVPAAILRPKVPKGGKRILAERFTGVWRRISFLRKVSLRNAVLYKQRFFLMIFGIGGCTALLLTGFGIRDSVRNVTDYQYEEITRYDAEVNFAGIADDIQQQDFMEQHGNIIESVLFLSEQNADITVKEDRKSVKLTSAAGDDIMSFISLRSADRPVSYPQNGEIILCRGIAEKLHLRVGETVTLTNDAFRQIFVTVTGIFDNYVGDYAFVSLETMAALYSETSVNAAYISFRPEADQEQAAAAVLRDEAVSHVSLNANTRKTIETSFSVLNFVVLLIIVCSGILAFIVLFNLININIEERIREIATIKVLGFFHEESAAYVFREIDLLTIAGIILGLPLGRLLHTFVMAQIRPDGICFDCRIAHGSYLFSIAVTFVFVVLVKFVMRYKLRKVSMAESLKSVE